jgi:hypothetical protein
MTTASMMRAVIGPSSTSATSTATVPATVAPTIGTNAPRKTSTPMASENGTLRAAAPMAMKTASVAATITVARTNWVSEIQATRPELSTRARAARGESRTSQAQIRLPSARKKNVENRTMKKPARR